MDWSSVLGSALIGAVVGGLGSLLAHVLKVGKNVLVGALVAVVTVSSSMGWRAYQRRQPVDYDQLVASLVESDSTEGMDRYLRQWALATKTYPEIRQWFEVTPTMSSVERQQQAMQLAQAGLRRLSDRILIQRAEALSLIVDLADEKDCAAFSRGDITAEGLNRIFSGMDDETLGRFSVITASALAAELRQSPLPRQVMTSDVAQSFVEISIRLGEDETQRLANNLQRMNTLPDDEACWTSRSLYKQIATLRGRNQDALALALVSN
ncbi:hypothetical protein D7Y21_17700 [Corallococcus sp. AB045]|uniref:hypothetical protein n=1 Tax=Corallococcus sp. AB045 TaxID=2316719 RepID=UPI000ED81F18|nr:hypothetical protein [Corallococcus sp. AB045]RKH87731.1 hypothetical protein D7Y21_17700 [Corallococcus sp. AB045]